MLKFFRKNISNQFIRICRIQYSSRLRNQNQYAEHHYKIKFNFDGIYDPISITNLNERVADVFISSNGLYFFSNVNNIYTKIVNDADNSYIDIGFSMMGLYDTNIKVSVETEESGSVQFYCDEANINDYTRQNFYGTDSNVMLYNGVTNTFLNANSNINISTAKQFTRITDMRAGNIAYVMSDGAIKNGDNASFTITTPTVTTYGRIIHIVSKAMNDLLIENI